MRRKYSQQQLRIIRRNYAKRSQREDRETIFSTILNIPGALGVIILLFIFLYIETKFFPFLFASIILGIIEAKLTYDAFKREGKRFARYI